ncbi:MAG: glycoside hydrolase family 2 TIM barrel-domain containing protein [Lutibacter sp.]|jgi:hypothetical protein|nr:glycoside hydrolase family 2 TIM barrel-domain containing protein [Lutibacter sp.]
MKYFLIILGISLCLAATQFLPEKPLFGADKPAEVRLVQNGEKFELLVNDKPFYIKGAGLEFGDIASLAKHSGNSFRTWRTDNGQQTGKQVLDKAHQHGLMVTMGIELGSERHGFDYNDPEAVQTQFDRVKSEVMSLKDHPALLIWGIGNELNLSYSNPKVWDAVNDIARMIHEIDPHHLTTTTLAGISKREVGYIKEKCPDIDILSIQMYGDLPQLPVLVRDCGWEGPYMVTEWGATGHWEVPRTEWGAPIEEHTTTKAANYLKRYQGGIEADSLQCIGSYVFLWGNKQERTPTWYGIFLENGRETESVDVMHYLWNGRWPDNRSPQIRSYTLDGKTAYDHVTLSSGASYRATIAVQEPEKDPLQYTWEILPESTDLKEGGDLEERPENTVFKYREPVEGSLEFYAPGPGQYRLFVYVDDGRGHAATANIPFKVIQP